MAGVEIVLLRITSNSFSLPVFNCHSFFYRNAGLFSIASATDIHDTKFDQPENPVAAKGTLDSSITPAEYVDFVNYLDATQLSRFGLHNGLSSLPFPFFFLS